jgi:hypothetical protein
MIGRSQRETEIPLDSAEVLWGVSGPADGPGTLGVSGKGPFHSTGPIGSGGFVGSKAQYSHCSKFNCQLSRLA